MKALGSTDSLDVRRAKALGDLARTQTALDLHAQVTTSTSTSSMNQDGLPAAREVVLHVHFDATPGRSRGDDSAGGGEGEGVRTVFGPTGRFEERQKLVLLDQVRAWCGDSRTKVTIKPVIDLNAELSAPGYEIPARIREQVILRDKTCVHPYCTRPARRADVDHVVEYDHDADAEGREQPGPTTSSNLAPLCRFHHRLKTFTAWTYRVIAPGVFEWTSPHGHKHLRDRTGTTRIDEPVEPPVRP
jgi:5-methylcytosine-specific restriction endonuclease McrA